MDDRHDDLGGARREGWSRLPQEDRSASGLSISLTRAPPPTDAYNSRAHVPPPPPAPPHEKDDLPAELAQTLKIVFIRQIPEKNNVADLHRLLQSFHQVAPIGIKIVRNGVFPSSRTGARVVNAYAAYEFAEDAQTIKHRLDGFKSEGEILQAVDGLPPLNHDGTPKLTGKRDRSSRRFSHLQTLLHDRRGVEVDLHDARLSPGLPSSSARPVSLATAATTCSQRASLSCSTPTLVSAFCLRG